MAHRVTPQHLPQLNTYDFEPIQINGESAAIINKIADKAIKATALLHRKHSSRNHNSAKKVQATKPPKSKEKASPSKETALTSDHFQEEVAFFTGKILSLNRLIARASSDPKEFFQFILNAKMFFGTKEQTLSPEQLEIIFGDNFSEGEGDYMHLYHMMQVMPSAKNRELVHQVFDYLFSRLSLHFKIQALGIYLNHSFRDKFTYLDADYEFISEKLNEIKEGIYREAATDPTFVPTTFETVFGFYNPFLHLESFIDSPFIILWAARAGEIDAQIAFKIKKDFGEGSFLTFDQAPLSNFPTEYRELCDGFDVEFPFDACPEYFTFLNGLFQGGEEQGRAINELFARYSALAEQVSWQFDEALSTSCEDHLILYIKANLYRAFQHMGGHPKLFHLNVLGNLEEQLKRCHYQGVEEALRLIENTNNSEGKRLVALFDVIFAKTKEEKKAALENLRLLALSDFHAKYFYSLFFIADPNRSVRDKIITKKNLLERFKSRFFDLSFDGTLDGLTAGLDYLINPGIKTFRAAYNKLQKTTSCNLQFWELFCLSFTEEIVRRFNASDEGNSWFISHLCTLGMPRVEEMPSTTAAFSRMYEALSLKFFAASEHLASLFHFLRDPYSEKKQQAADDFMKAIERSFPDLWELCAPAFTQALMLAFKKGGASKSRVMFYLPELLKNPRSKLAAGIIEHEFSILNKTVAKGIAQLFDYLKGPSSQNFIIASRFLGIQKEENLETWNLLCIPFVTQVLDTFNSNLYAQKWLFSYLAELPFLSPSQREMVFLPFKQVIHQLSYVEKHPFENLVEFLIRPSKELEPKAIEFMNNLSKVQVTDYHKINPGQLWEMLLLPFALQLVLLLDLKRLQESLIEEDLAILSSLSNQLKCCGKSGETIGKSGETIGLKLQFVYPWIKTQPEWSSF